MGSEATMKKKTVKAFLKLRNKILTEKKIEEDTEQESPDVVITEVIETVGHSARQQIAGSRKSVKKMARKQGKKNKKKTVLVVEDVQEDDGIIETKVVVTLEELRAARTDVTKSVEERQAQAQKSTEVRIEEEEQLVHETYAVVMIEWRRRRSQKRN